MHRLVAIGHPLVAAIGSEEELQQVVAADGKKVDFMQEGIRSEGE